METLTLKAHIGLDKYKTIIESGTQHWLADEPADHGGADSGPSPFQHILAGLGACTTITLRMYADRKQWPLQSVDVQLSLATENGLTQIGRDIQLHGTLSAEQKDRLLQIANTCPVHKMLTGTIHINTQLL